MGRRLHTDWWRKRPKQLRLRQRLRRTQAGGSRRWRRRWWRWESGVIWLSAIFLKN